MNGPGPGPSPSSAQKTAKRAWWWALFGVLALVSGFCALAFALGVTNAASGNLHKGETRTGAVVAAVFLLAVAVGAAGLARLCEHHARVGAGRGAGSKGGSARPAGGRWLVHHSKRLERVWVILAGAILVGGSISGFLDWHRSQEVQGHGLATTGTVTEVVAVYHSSRYGSYTTYNLDVKLSAPVDGQTATVVYTPYEEPPATVGQEVNILLDRSDLDYAELPGAAANSVWGGLAAPVLIGVVVLVNVVAAPGPAGEGAPGRPRLSGLVGAGRIFRQGVTAGGKGPGV